MEIVELTLIYKSAKTQNFNIIILPKRKNVYNLTSEAHDEIIGVLLNLNDKNYLRQIFEENFIKNLQQSLQQNANTSISNLNENSKNQNNNFLHTILSALGTNEVAKHVFMRDLFFSLCNNEIKELRVPFFFDLCVWMLETETNTFLKNEILKKFVFAIINFAQYYHSVTVKDEYQVCKAIKLDSEIIYKRKAFDVLFKMVQTEPCLKKNLVNYLIDLLCHFYNVSVIDKNLVPRDDVKEFIELLQKETFAQKQVYAKFSPTDFYENVHYLDDV